MRALVIDDDAAVRGVLELVLTLEGFEVELAHDGLSGLAAAQATPPDVILLDVMMPDVSGWDVAQRLASDPLLARVPVVFCTAMADDEATWRGWKLGAASYVAKPFNNSQLIDEVFRSVREVAA